MGLRPHYSFMSTIRYAIRISPGLYSNGPRVKPVPLNKAKLWTNIGHVKTHLQGAGDLYSPGAEVVSLLVEYQETTLHSVEELVSKRNQEVQARRAQEAERSAKRELEAAELRLKKAQERARAFQ